MLEYPMVKGMRVVNKFRGGGTS